MRFSKIMTILIGIQFLAIVGCGGGGGGGGSIPQSSTIISGVASKGPINGGTVNVFALDATGAKSSSLKSGPTDNNGAFSIDIGTYTGPVLLEVSGGSYTDEATGSPVNIPAGSAFLRAALPSVTPGTVPAAVTPLTELAVRRAGQLTATKIIAANKVVSDLFHVDVINVKPVATTAAAIGAATPDQQIYTLALAAVSQMAKDLSTTVDATINNINNDIPTTTNIMTSAMATTFSGAVTSFLSGQGSTLGVTAPPALTSNLGKRKATLTTSVAGISGNNAYSIKVELGLPSGYDFTGYIDSVGGVLPSFISTSTGGVVDARFDSVNSKLVLAVVTTQSPLIDGAIMNVQFDVFPGFDVNAITKAITEIKGNVGGNLGVALIVPGANVATTIQ